MEFEILLVQPEFERVVLPFAKNLERLGIAATVRTVDTAQYRRRLDDFDFDMIVRQLAASRCRPATSSATSGARSRGPAGQPELHRHQDPVVDALIDGLIAAPDRASLVNRVRALDRVLQWGYYVIPQWHLPYDRVAYWDKFGYPPSSRPWACNSTPGGSTQKASRSEQ